MKMHLTSGIGRVGLVIGLYLLPCLSRAELHTFTDQQGRSMKAEILSATPTRVKIKREDGQIFEVPHHTFVLSDRKYIEEWIKAQKANVPLRLRIEVSQTRKTVERSTSASMQNKTVEAGYRITIKNTGSEPVEGCSIEYRIFRYADQAGVQEKERKLTKISGKINDVKIARFDQGDFNTEALKLEVTQLQPGWYWASGANPRAADTLAGIWLRVINSAGEMVDEYTTNEGLKAEGW